MIIGGMKKLPKKLLKAIHKHISTLLKINKSIKFKTTNSMQFYDV